MTVGNDWEGDFTVRLKAVNWELNEKDNDDEGYETGHKMVAINST